MFDLLLSQGVVFNGENASPVTMDVAIRDGKIAAMGRLTGARARATIDATNKIVAPGFIDVQHRGDVYWSWFRHPHAESMVLQGVTTVIGGKCGTSLAPLLKPEAINALRKWIDVRDSNASWTDMASFFDVLAKQPASINRATEVGHLLIRRGLIGDTERALTGDELAVMLNQLELSLDAGAVGISVGLAFAHGRSADDNELQAIFSLAAQKNKVVSVHVGDEGEGLVAALARIIRLAARTSASVQFSHFKVEGKRAWPLFTQMLQMLEEAQAAGLSINYDIYPYATSKSVLYTYLPAWFTKGGLAAMLTRLADPAACAKVAAEMREQGIEYERMTIASAPMMPMLVGTHVQSLMTQKGKDAPEMILELLLATRGQATVLYQSMSEDNVVAGMRHPLGMVATDGAGVTEDMRDERQVQHPRSFGAMTRFLGRYVRDQHVLMWEEALYKITGMPATKYRLPNRGFLREGYAADVVVFDPRQLHDAANFVDPYRYSKGMDYVLVNGVPVVAAGRVEKETPGALITVT